MAVGRFRVSPRPVITLVGASTLSVRPSVLDVADLGRVLDVEALPHHPVTVTELHLLLSSLFRVMADPETLC